MKTKASIFAGLVLAMAFASRAAAQEPPPYAPPPAAPVGGPSFGAPGQLVISDDLVVAVNHQSRSLMGDSVSGTAIQFQPAVDFFVIPNLSIGGALSVAYESGDDDSGISSSTTLIGIMPRVGYNIPLAPTVSLWPRLALGYVHASFDVGGTSFSGYVVPIEVFVPVLFHPVPHFFIGAGPILSTDLISKVEGQDAEKTTNIGLVSTIGGHFGGM